MNQFNTKSLTFRSIASIAGVIALLLFIDLLLRLYINANTVKEIRRKNKAAQ